MKKLLSASIAAATVATMGVAAPAFAEVSANAGFVSDYYFRGANLGDGGAYGGVDYEQSGFYAGVWAIDDSTGGNDGLEVDYYLGYGMEHGDFSWSLGLSSYQYTYSADFENEVNIGLAFGGESWGSIGLDIAVGNDEDPENGSGAGVDVEQGYVYAALSYSKDAYSVTYGMTSAGDAEVDGTDVDDTDWDSSYLEASAGTEVATMDMGITVGKQIDNNAAGEEVDNSDYYLVLDISKSFSF